MKKAEQLFTSFLEVEKDLALEAAYGRLSRQVAHDLRSPLGAFRVAIQVLKSNKATYHSHKSEIELAEKANHRIDEILSLLLKRPKQCNSEITEVHSVIDEAMGYVSTRQDKAPVRIVRNYTLEPLFVYQQKVDLLRVLINIFENAFDAVEPCGRIMVGTELRDSQIYIAISDSGVGIAPSDLQRIFERGFTKGKANGNGEGLSIVEELVFANKGTISVSSEPGQGTEIVLSFPLWTQKTDTTVGGLS